MTAAVTNRKMVIFKKKIKVRGRIPSKTYNSEQRQKLLKA